MKNIKGLLLGLFLILGMSVLQGCNKKNSSIVVGAKDYTEQDVLGNILVELIREHTKLKVEYKSEMSSNILFAAMKSGDIDVSIDYTGTVYANYLGNSEMKSETEIYDISKKELKEKYNLIVLNPLGFNNTYSLGVMPETAKKYNLKTISDLAKVSSGMTFGGGFEILNRIDGIKELKKVYNMDFKKEIAIEGVLRYSAIQGGEVQVTEAFKTDGMLMKYDIVILKDDKKFFPFYNAVPIISGKTAKKYPELLKIIAKLEGTLNDETMKELNYRVDVLKENPKVVAREFLKSVGLMK